jgi:hypothetical protein
MWFSGLGVLCASAVTAVALRAAEGTGATADKAADSFSQIAERFGLWAALCVLLVLACVYAMYKQTVFVQTTLVKLITANQRAIERNTEALKDSPCGRRQGEAQDREQLATE